MAKKKNEPIEQEAVFEEVEVNELEEEVADEEAPAIEETPIVATEDFHTRTLKAINKMENHAKAKRLAERLMRKKARKQ